MGKIGTNSRSCYTKEKCKMVLSVHQQFSRMGSAIITGKSFVYPHNVNVNVKCVTKIIH
jgi:hypothetical protein